MFLSRRTLYSLCNFTRVSNTLNTYFLSQKPCPRRLNIVVNPCYEQICQCVCNQLCPCLLRHTKDHMHYPQVRFPVLLQLQWEPPGFVHDSSAIWWNTVYLKISEITSWYLDIVFQVETCTFYTCMYLELSTYDLKILSDLHQNVYRYLISFCWVKILLENNVERPKPITQSPHSYMWWCCIWFAALSCAIRIIRNSWEREWVRIPLRPLLKETINTLNIDDAMHSRWTGHGRYMGCLVVYWMKVPRSKTKWV